ncbi:MAG TPA: nucleotide sugar dehydrogenase, partial [Tepiditoga sp.]|nr:nucleotide sugar dehydrogenase [Tepiditoga sp.]
MNLYEKITSRTAKIGVIGLGYVGLPLAVEKAKAGFTVIGFDIQENKVDMVNKGINYIGDVVNAELEEIVKSGKLKATNNFDFIKECDAVMICVPTPLDKFKQPDLTYVVNSTEEVGKRIHSDMLVVLESTTYPGTTRELMKPILEAGGLKAGKDFYLAYSPEREDPGNKHFTTKTIPKVVGGFMPTCKELARKLYSLAIDKMVPVSSLESAESAKILENVYRCINIAMVNELKMVFD